VTTLQSAQLYRALYLAYTPMLGPLHAARCALRLTVEAMRAGAPC
jgi:hypothetical protein